MSLSNPLQQKIQSWLATNERRCPKCDGGAEGLVATGVRSTLHPAAAGGTGIDTSYEASVADIKCTQCGFAAGFLVLDDLGLA